MTQSNESTKQTPHDVQLPARANQRSGFGEAYYVEQDGTLIGYQGDQRAEGDNAWSMLKWDLQDDDAHVEENLSTEELPTEFKPVAADGGEQ